MKPIDVKPGSGATDKPSVLAGDSIYYRHPETDHPAYGTVAGIGKHGMLVDSECGAEHKVHWDKYIAHKARAERKLTIVDRGEDGSIMEDEAGKKVFVHGALEDYIPPSEPMAKAIAPTPLQNAQLIRELAAAGFDTPLAHVREQFGQHFTKSLPAPDAPAPDYSSIVQAINRLYDAQAAQFQGLCGAIAMMAEKIGDTATMQQSMMAVIAEARKTQDISITMPDVVLKSEPASVQVDVHVPQQAAPVVTVGSPAVSVEAPVVNFSPTIDVHVPEAPAPVVNVAVPAKKTITEIERDREGNITRAVQQDVDL